MTVNLTTTADKHLNRIMERLTGYQEAYVNQENLSPCYMQLFNRSQKLAEEYPFLKVEKHANEISGLSDNNYGFSLAIYVGQRIHGLISVSLIADHEIPSSDSYIRFRVTSLKDDDYVSLKSKINSNGLLVGLVDYSTNGFNLTHHIITSKYMDYLLLNLSRHITTNIEKNRILEV